MKKLFKSIASTVCAGILALSVGACGSTSNGLDGATLLSSPSEPKKIGETVGLSSGLMKLYSGLNFFSAEFASAAYELKKGENVAVSPISVYSALLLAAACSDGNTQSQILSAMRCNYETLTENFPTVYALLNRERRDDKNALVSTVRLTNSVWLDKATQVKDEGMKELSEKFYSYIYQADFQFDNKKANEAIRAFVKDKTKGLIDKNFNLSKETAFALMNTLYLKDVWNDKGDDLRFTENTYAFTQSDGSVKNVKLLQGKYCAGQLYDMEKASAFYTQTYSGYKIKFIVPKDGYGVDDIFDDLTLWSVNGRTDWREYEEVEEDDEESIFGRKYYYARCLFPEFKADYDEDIIPAIKDGLRITDLFEPNLSSAHELTQEDVYCSQVKHVATLTVDKKGIEGAAVTSMAFDLTSAGNRGVYSDFIIDKAFAFIITDCNDISLFSGVINKL